MSNSDPEAEEAGAEAGGGEVVVAGEESNKLMISFAALRWGTGPEDEGVGSLELEPNISAKRSCVDGPAAAPLEGGVTVLSSPMRSTIESLSVLVDPTGLRSLTISSAYTLAIRSRNLTRSHHRSPDLWRGHPLHDTRLDLVFREQATKFDRPLLNLKLQITREPS